MENKDAEFLKILSAIIANEIHQGIQKSSEEEPDEEKSKSTISKYSSQQTTNNAQIVAKDEESYNEFLQNRRRATNERDELFNDFLNEYTIAFKNKQDQKNKLKKLFFILIMVLFFLIAATPIIVITLFSTQDNLVGFSVAIIGSFVELFTAFIVLPRIIAEYLFDKKEDSDLVTIIEKMQSYNLEKLKEEHK